jgi:hypothetical protein
MTDQHSWLNGVTPFTNIENFRASISGGSYYITAECVDTISNGGPTSFNVGTYASSAAADIALTSFVEEVGFPFIKIGSMANVDTSGTIWIVAYNLALLPRWAMGDTAGHTGLASPRGSTWSTAGYEPWADAATAITGILDLVGNVTFPS